MQKYKIIIFSKDVYREYVLQAEKKETIKIGTTKNCNVRFNKDMFFEEFELDVVNIANEWQIYSDDNIYFTTNGVMKFATKELVHGDSLVVKYKKSNSEVFKINFFIDFDSVERNYNRIIDISRKESVLIGGIENNDIFIVDGLLGQDTVSLIKETDGYYIVDNNTKYGVYVNGEKANKKAKINDYDFFMIVGYSFYYKFEKLYTTISENVKIRNLEYRQITDKTSSLDYPKFNRSTRVKYVLPRREVEILLPKAMPIPPKTNIILLISPTIAMIALTIILRGIIANNGTSTFVLYSVISMVITALATIAGYILKKKDYKKEVKERETKYLEYIKNKEVEIESIRKEEENILKKIYKSIDENVEAVKAFDKNLFDKDINDEDFLFTRIGTGSIPASCKIKYKVADFKDTDDELMSIPEMTAMRYHNIINAPVVSKLSESNGIGIIGKKNNLYDFLKNVTLDIAIRHFYKDVKMIYIFDYKDKEMFSWVRWLKHVENEDINARNLVYDEESNKYILEYMYSILSRREREAQESKNIKFYTNFVVFVFDNNSIKTHPISKYIEKANDYGFTFLFFEENDELLPKGCTEIIHLSETQNVGELFLSQDRNNKVSFEYEPISDMTAKEIALKLTPISIDEVSLDSDLTKNITLFKLLDIMTVDDLDIRERWGNSKVTESMAAPLGVKVKDEIVYLDLNEKHHGPHGLVAGTTGSGKSEILQTYILSMATLFHPYEVSFVIIDFKGGGMVNQFENLPHLIGSITNIDGREINRSLMSIKAELRKRQELFSINKVNHVDDYIELYKKDNTLTPLPHLIIIVDEFAELKTEYPDFMKELISAARIGRSLGVHLILSTQKPSGVVDSQIWSNSKFKLCLKVQTKEDSNEVIKTPLAAEIVEPGRAYLQVGNNEQFDLFQSAYSRAKVSEGDTSNKNVFELYELNLWGKKKCIFSNKKKTDDKTSQSQLEAIVEYINNYCVNNNISHLQGICLPPLKDVIYFDEIEKTQKDVSKGILITVGVYDDPEQQIQSELVVNLSESNTYIVGSAQTGKTILLQSILKDLISTYMPEEVNIYVIDCGNMSLKVFEKSKLVGGVVIPSEEERISNLFKMLDDEISLRKNIFAKNMVGTHSAYLEAGFKDLPQIFLIIDNVTAFREYYPEIDGDILMLSRDGQGVGINIISTATQANAMSYKALSNFGTRVAMNCNDKGEYSNIFDRCRLQPKEVAGRALFSIEKRIVEFQVSLPIRGNKEIERFENLKSFVDERNATIPCKKAKPIPQVPEIIRGDEFFNDNKELFEVKYKIPIGIEYEKVSYKHLDLLENELFAVMGRNKAGKTNFVTHILSSINKTIFNNLTEAYVIDSADHQLEKVKNYGFVKKYTIDPSDTEEILEDILDKLEERQDYVNKNRGIKSDKELLDKFPLLMLVIENSEFINEMSRNKELYQVFVKITKQLKMFKVCIIFSNIENTTVAYNAPDILKQLKENKKIVVFDDVTNFKFLELSLKQQKLYSKPIGMGDGYLFFGGEIEKIKTILDV